jgi:hypothetical protein
MAHDEDMTTTRTITLTKDITDGTDEIGVEDLAADDLRDAEEILDTWLGHIRSDHGDTAAGLRNVAGTYTLTIRADYDEIDSATDMIEFG